MNLRIERLEDRRLLASDLGQIAGTVLNDLQNDSNTANDVAVAGLTVSLYQDGNANSTFDGSATDALVGSTTTDSNGDYAFADLSAGTYFVQITPTSGLQVLSGGDLQTVTISSVEAAGSTGLTIDDFSTAQTVTASRSGGDTGTTDASDADGTNANSGGVRDLYVNATTVGNVTLTSQFGGGNVLSLESSSGTEGIARVTWDGTDGDGDAVDPDNLSLDFYDSGNNVGVLVSVSADSKPGATVTLRLTSGSGNSAEATVTIEDQDGLLDGDAEEDIMIPFSAFTENVQGTGVDFTNVTAIEMELDFTDSSINGLDARVEVVGVVGYTTKTADFSVLNRMSIGDQVFADLDNDGVFDSGESGIADVIVSLYEDTDSSGTYTDGVDVLLATDTTDSSGNYLFEDLTPGDYVLRIAATEFDASEPLEGLVSSTGNETAGVAPDADDDVDDDDNGYSLSTFGVVTQAITLVGDSEPTTDGDADADTNLSVDFGFYGFDLTIVKDVDLATITPDGTLTYTAVVTNAGPSNAYNVAFSDTLPTGVTFASGSTDVGTGTVTNTSGTITADLGDLAAGASATVTILVTVDSETTGTLVNTASVTADDEADTSNNSDTASTTVTELIDLAVTKVDDDGGEDIAPGDTVVYTIDVTNNGPSTATNVVLTDTLPDDVTFDAGSSTTPDTNTGGVLTYNLGTMASGATTTVTVAVTVDTDFTGTLTNTATVDATESESNETNNTATAGSTVAVETSSIAGYVYVDADNDGVFDAGEQPIAGVLITLTGTDFTSAAVSSTTTTATDGSYSFTNLLPGTYQVTETDPTFYGDGQDTAGSEGGTATDDDISAITLGSGVTATAYNFGELAPTLSKRRFLASSATSST